MNKQPFLTIITRSYKKPKCLAKNIASVKAQLDQDLEQVFIIDDVGRGLAWADQALDIYKSQNNGKYIMILDDDDIIVDNMFVTTIKLMAQQKDPDVIIWRGRFPSNNKTLPPHDIFWGVRPIKNLIGSFNYCIRKEIYDKTIRVCTTGKTGDYDLISAIFNMKPAPTIIWCDKIFVETQQKSKGSPLDFI